jgi:hypothetical protein
MELKGTGNALGLTGVQSHDWQSNPAIAVRVER